MFPLRSTLLSALVALGLFSCADNDAIPSGPQPIISMTDSLVHSSIAKWYDNHAGAVSLTYDSGSPEERSNIKAQMLAHAYQVPLAYEFVSRYYREAKYLSDYLRTVMIPMGIPLFGHGDEHVNHDAMTYDQAFASFTRCYQTMLDFGLTPVSYAYPGGYCYEEETRLALKNSGFLSGRKFSSGDYLDPYIVPDTVSEPPDWFYLPTLIMEGYHIAQNERCVGSPEELGQYLDEAVRRKAWIIPTYHLIYDVQDPQGYYRMADFERDLQEIQKRDVWRTTMDAATLYIKERQQAVVSVVWHKDAQQNIPSISISLADKLDNNRFNQPLTVMFELPSAWVGKVIGIYENDLFLTTFSSITAATKISLRPFETVYTLQMLETK